MSKARLEGNEVSNARYSSVRSFHIYDRIRINLVDLGEELLSLSENELFFKRPLGPSRMITMNRAARDLT